MKTIAFFNNKGGVGKTSLIYHLSWMFAEMGVRVLAADLDPQANLTAMCFAEEELERFYDNPDRATISTAVTPLMRGVGDVRLSAPRAVSERFHIVPGDLNLSEFEDDLSTEWPECLDRNERAFRVSAAFHRVIAHAGSECRADLVLIDVGPNFGAINRAALISADYVVIPVAPDLFSVRGLENVGRRLKSWRIEWQDRIARAPDLGFSLPAGKMEPIGYVVSRHTQFASGVVKAYQRWIDKIPEVYRGSVDDPPIPDDGLMLGRLRDYRSLIAMAQEARKPMFLLKPGDGAIGGHQGAVRSAHDDFFDLAISIAEKVGYEIL